MKDTGLDSAAVRRIAVLLAEAVEMIRCFLRGRRERKGVSLILVLHCLLCAVAEM